MNYDQLYGMTIDEYCKAHNTNVDNLINKTNTDIKLLEKRLKHLVWKDNKLLEPIVGSCFMLLNKKRKHLKRLKKWKKENK